MKSFLSGLSLLFIIPFAVNSQTVKLKSSEGYIQTRDSVRLFYRLIGEGKDTIVVFHGVLIKCSVSLFPNLHKSIAGYKMHLVNSCKMEQDHAYISCWLKA